ncbi:MAG: hypothetical protein US60_C0006G0031 [Microgenomates group bacterium GW2011_GWC1_37_8]|uniref:Uncharacterized protein n=1 Tax=Candidatus Woesebacteria bacterium GW2011_GWB1_38_8 TaxID=1618570 RepID=A0A0G0NGW1_9BACT|nr:MAG: hypothetical protein US60_C0006G0031 [Microgenomates group bacterium GW2011_GWC1_37_8]KKQ85104.1 MAG: hypothetical protein UT08_C0010G0031 [Candidatus Woesebacteria bacterium GW2011_GWB1_38_8]
MSVEQKIDLNINPLQGGIQGWQDILELSSQQEPISDNEILDYSNLQDIRELNGLTVSGGSILETLGEVVFSPRDGVGNSTLREGLRSMTDVLNPLSITESYELQEKAIKAESGQRIVPERRSLGWTAEMFEGLPEQLSHIGVETYDRFGDHNNHPQTQLEAVQLFKQAAAGVVHSWAYGEVGHLPRGEKRTVNNATARVALKTYIQLEQLEVELIKKLQSQGVEVPEQKQIGQILKYVPLSALTVLIVTSFLISACGGGNEAQPNVVPIDPSTQAGEIVPSTDNTSDINVDTVMGEGDTSVTFNITNGTYTGGLCNELKELVESPYEGYLCNVRMPQMGAKSLTFPFDGGVLFEQPDAADGKYNGAVEFIFSPYDVAQAIAISSYLSQNGGSQQIESAPQEEIQPQDERAFTFENLQLFMAGTEEPSAGSDFLQITVQSDQGMPAENLEQEGDTFEVWSFTKLNAEDMVNFEGEHSKADIEDLFDSSLSGGGNCTTDHISKDGDVDNQALQIDCIKSNIDVSKIADFFGLTEQELLDRINARDGITREVLRKVEEVTIATVTSNPVSGITESEQFMITEDYELPIDEGLEPPSVEEDRQGLSKGFWIACLGIPTLAVTAAWFTSLYYKFKSRKRG